MALWRIDRTKNETGDKSSAGLYGRVRAGTFTQPVKVGGARAVGWPSDEVQAIVAARVAGKTDDEIRSLVNTLHEQRATRFAELAARLAEPTLQ